MKVVELGFCSQTRPVSLSKTAAPPMTRRNRSAVASGSLHPFGDSDQVDRGQAGQSVVAGFDEYVPCRVAQHRQEYQSEDAEAQPCPSDAGAR